MGDAVIPVRVALRCRPLVSKEKSDGCQSCLTFVTNEQVILGKDKAFTYDCVHSPEICQTEVYNTAVFPLIDNLFKGYNVTVLAYGQTGSGKTYTMGTSYMALSTDDEDQVGIIPRAVNDLFKGIKRHSNDSQFNVKVSFLEIYKEEAHDLLRPSSERNKDAVAIREDNGGEIKISGLIEENVKTMDDVMLTLQRGSLARSTGSTAMNAHSSRSHAIFTINLEKLSKGNPDDQTRAKFHLVDLAGSEKANRTQAQGERFKEGVNINKGLLALGNVINSLCDKSSHVPYRDSKLTRLLQDSLGGNSHTVMIACVSPADYNIEETLNTLRYADRARKIKNKPIVNRDPQSIEINNLKQLIGQLKSQLLEAGVFPSSASVASSADSDELKTLLERNKLLETQNCQLEVQKNKLRMENNNLVTELQTACDQTTNLCEKAVMAEIARDKLKQNLEELKEQTNNVMQKLGNSDGNDNNSLIQDINDKIMNIQNEHHQDEMELSKCVTEKIVCDETVQLSPQSESQRLEHTLRHTEMQRQLQTLNDALDKKQQLAEQMMQHDSQLETMKVHYENVLKEMQNEVTTLQMEKEEMSTNLRQVKSNPTAVKLSEQRRKRLQELEGKMSDLKKKIFEQGKMLTMKDQVEKKVSSLSNDIVAMKQQRVKLIKQMKEDAQQFSKWKSNKDKEVAKLKQQDRKRQYEFVKMERIHTKQQNVMKRKIEEAVMHNRRLKDALDKRLIIASERNKKGNSDLDGMKDRTRRWLEQEIEVAVSQKETVHHLDFLLEDRKMLNRQLNEYKERLKSPEPATKSKKHDEEDLSPSKTEDLRLKIDNLKSELEIRNDQIADMQQKVLDAHQDDSVKKRWDNLQTMIEAKCALKWLFDHVIKTKMNLFQFNLKHGDVVFNLEEASKDHEALKAKYKELEDSMNNIEREYEEKILYLLSQLPSNFDSSRINDASLVDRIKFQENELSRLGSIYEEYQKVTQMNEQLKRQLTVSRLKGTKKFKLLPDISQLQTVPEKHKKTNETCMTYKCSSSSEEEDNATSDGDDKDPDWHYTPDLKRFRKSSLQVKKAVQPKKSGCGCRSGCSQGNKKCKCRKAENACDENCRCDKNICSNRLKSKLFVPDNDL